MYDGDPHKYSMVQISLRLKRRTLFYIINYVVPSFIMSILATLGLLLPVESGQKLNLGNFFRFESILKCFKKYIYLKK